jgi:hypothetical protein
MFAKSDSYYFDAEAAKEGVVGYERERRLREKAQGLSSRYKLTRDDDGFSGQTPPSPSSGCRSAAKKAEYVENGRCLRSAWWLPLENATDAWFLNPGGNSDVAGKHFALFPSKLPELCIKMSTSERGVCPKCGAAWARVIESRHDSAHTGTTDSAYETGTTANRLALLRQQARKNGGEFATQSRTIGWRPTCGCEAGEPVPATVLDCFAGLSTSGVAALRLGRSYIGIELNPKYAEMSRKRLADAVQQGRRFIGVEIDPGYAKIATERIDRAARQGRLAL